MKYFRALLMVTVIGLVTVQLFSCKDDDEPTFSFPSSPIVDSNGYTMGGTLVFLYSVDNGVTFTATVPTGLASGTKVLVKVNNGTTDLLAEDFTFDWSGSVPAPTDASAQIAEFVITGNATPSVKITDKMTIITSHRTNGKFYSVNPSSGVTKEEFTPTYNGTALLSARAFVYHYKKGLFYASQNTDAGGYLYTINPATKVATRINENNGANGAQVWDAIVNWAVATDDSLVSVGDFNGDGNGIVKFGTNGGRSAKTAEADICCALGMIYDAPAKKLLVANAWSTNDKQVLLETYTQAGVLTGTPLLITTFNGFPEDFATSWVNLRCMVKDADGVIYGVLFNNDTKKTFFVKVSVTASSITYVSTLGTDNNNIYNSLAIVPHYTL